MLKKIIKIIVIVIVVLVLLLGCVMLSDSVRIAGRCKQYVDDYQEFYLYKGDYKPFFVLNMGQGIDNGYKIWFLPGQKGKLLKKIKEDINSELASIVANHSDILKGYKTSDNFKKIYIYYYKNISNDELNRKLENEPIGQMVTLKIELYNEFIYGYVNAVSHEDNMEYVGVE